MISKREKAIQQSKIPISQYLKEKGVKEIPKWVDEVKIAADNPVEVVNPYTEEKVILDPQLFSLYRFILLEESLMRDGWGSGKSEEVDDAKLLILEADRDVYWKLID